LTSTIHITLPRPSVARDLWLALCRIGIGQHREIVEHDDGVLDEGGVGTAFDPRDLDRHPTRRPQARGTPLPLGEGEVDIDRRALEVCDETVGEAGAGTADAGAIVHPTIVRCPRVHR
jgi:hypothetical protein